MAFDIEQAKADQWWVEIMPEGAKDWYRARYQSRMEDRTGDVRYNVFEFGEQIKVRPAEIRNIPQPAEAEAGADPGRIDELEEIRSAFGLHPDTSHEKVLDTIKNVRHEARAYPDLQLKLADTLALWERASRAGVAVEYETDLPSWWRLSRADGKRWRRAVDNYWSDTEHYTVYGEFADALVHLPAALDAAEKGGG